MCNKDMIRSNQRIYRHITKSEWRRKRTKLELRKKLTHQLLDYWGNIKRESIIEQTMCFAIVDFRTMSMYICELIG